VKIYVAALKALREKEREGMKLSLPPKFGGITSLGHRYFVL
jgi:hypothetical protein